MTQAQAVYEYLRGGGTLTAHKALTQLGVSRLAARIDDIKHGRGAPKSIVYRRMVTVPTRHGKTKVMQYWIGGANENLQVVRAG